MASGLISEDEKQKVRNSVDLVALMGERTPMKQKGRDFWCCCPVHNEKTPSCKVDPVLQLWHCFGCGEGGDVFAYLMKADGMNFSEAVQYLADRAHIELERNAQASGPSSNEKQRLKAICAETAEFYHLQLMRSGDAGAAKAREYLKSRNLGGDIPKEWKLGYAPGNGQLVRHLSAKHFKAQEMVMANVATMGKDGRPRDRFYERVMFPISDVAGEPIAFGGRIMGEGQPKYLNSSENPLFYKSQVLYGLHKAKASMATTGIAIVCEGYTDVISLHRAGITNAVATLGTALTRQHIRLLSRHAKNGIVYLFDGDAAGQRAADRALQFIDASMTPEAGVSQIALSAVTLPDNLDPADFIEQRGAEALRSLLSQAKPLLEYGIERRIEKFDLSRAEGRSQAFASALEVLAPIKDSLLAKDYAVQIAGMTRMREDEALGRLVALKQPQTRAEEPQPAIQTPASNQVSEQLSLSPSEVSRRRFEREFLCICTQNPHLGVEYADALACTNWHDHMNEFLSEAILDMLSENANATAADIVSAACDVVPAAGGILTGLYASSKGTPDEIAAYLVEELALGDMEESINDLRQKLKNPAGASEEEYDLYFKSVAAMQKELAERRKAHKPLS